MLNFSPSGHLREGRRRMLCTICFALLRAEMLQNYGQDRRRSQKFKKKSNLKNFSELNKIILKKPEKDWKKYDVILGEPLEFRKIKNIKLIKENIFEIIKKPMPSCVFCLPKMQF